MEFAIVENEGICPSCGSVSKTVLSGQEFVIKEIRIKE
jgi:Zn finger protein HypA/HybF involved in hydrogenase expression